MKYVYLIQSLAVPDQRYEGRLAASGQIAVGVLP